MGSTGYITKDARGRYRYTIKSSNGKVVEKAEEGFARIQHVINRIFKRPEVSSIVVSYVRWPGRPQQQEVTYQVDREGHHSLPPPGWRRRMEYK